MISRTEAAGLVDHTLLRPDATRLEIEALVAEAAGLGAYAVCVEGRWVEDAVSVASGRGLKIVTVCGFPTGRAEPEAKAAEAAGAVSRGADEVDMVADLEAVRLGEWGRVEHGVAAVRAAIDEVEPGRTLKVILETAAFGDKAIEEAALAAERGGANFVKTSTGFHPAGGASVEAVRLLHEVVGGRLGIKASGGIRTAAEAVALLEAGATRIGTSRTRDILDGWGTQPDG
ncbi:MAG: deoxyribose-phosphate aldolase [Demequinaceae bacterium]|nr:deoxyribose-phosphate aldolase [Demequinaceae bacterium]